MKPRKLPSRQPIDRDGDGLIYEAFMRQRDAWFKRRDKEEAKKRKVRKRTTPKPKRGW